MKKIIGLLALVFAVVATGPKPAYAEDAPLVSESVADQFLASLTKDMVAVYAHTSHNEDKVYALTSLIQLGHYKKDYILSLDFGMVGSGFGENGISFHKTYGVHAHVLPWVVANVPMNPTLSAFLSNVELTPRYSYDEDVRHGVLSYTLGARVAY